MARIAIVEKDKCHPLQCGDYYCVRLCPINRTGKECIIKTEQKKVGINTELCTGCGICPKRCPFDALHIIKLPEELDKDPIHRYGKNGFHLYNLPVPMFGKVTGIVGKNGIGKSTAVKIMAGMLKPNLGREKEADIKELIAYFKGQEAQVFFEKLRDDRIKISYKPQEVDVIQRKAKGKVIDLLKKVDEKKMLGEYAKKLDIGKILENDITKISGGEMQRVAICAAVLKNANVYFFDEPASYLDIKQRLNVARFIKGLAGKDTAVVVVEHDLIILDYMADLIYLMYGTPGCYGITSLPKSAKAGINLYLDGYIKDENMRFRDHAIKFMVKPPTSFKKARTLTSWEGIHKKLGNFRLDAKSGDIKIGEVCGILGENGIGKTSFVKILAGEAEKDMGNVSVNVKVSYKPQYISIENDIIVMNLLNEAVNKYDIEIIRPLDIKPLLTKKISELSGGELQRVAIAECLSKNAELYLLDEPSAYLDVEQRLIISRVIRNVMHQKGASCLVVDHDLLFLDYLSDRLSVFTGEPAVHGQMNGPFEMEEGMNLFLKDINMTFRRDQESHRPRANKLDSQMDKEQKAEGKLYYG